MEPRALVGQKLLDGLASRGHKPKELLLGASSRSAGQTRMFHNEELTVQTVDDVLAQKPKWAIFSAGSGVSKEWAPRFLEAGCRVIDNSSCWRMEDTVPLVVPEINLDSVNDSHGIIANPIVQPYSSSLPCAMSNKNSASNEWSLTPINPFPAPAKKPLLNL